MAGYIDPKAHNWPLDKKVRENNETTYQINVRVQMELTEALRKIEELKCENARLKEQLVPLTDQQRIALLESKVREMSATIECLTANDTELFKRTRGNVIYGASNV